MTSEETRVQNDALRARLPATLPEDRFVMTRSVAALDPLEIQRLMYKVKTFNDFSEDNDPYGEHDFGVIEQRGEKYFWKIDFYGGEEGINRLLTILRADEY